ncbi:hypothetical protein OPV22_017787 [Ensete ventricosum]|uniref:Uncharacterized protein n=1 Tax=Ensete ventricosum TaxID=4639 RepID=A0AAV8QYR8_ENSVE|nr:hypothetical protein OPV22_017787 [Ensete ventricosum]
MKTLVSTGVMTPKDELSVRSTTSGLDSASAAALEAPSMTLAEELMVDQGKEEDKPLELISTYSGTTRGVTKEERT